MHRTLRRAAVWAAAIAALVVALPPSSHGEEEWPGLPETDGTFGQYWMGAAQGGISYASRAKQWFRSPDGMVTFRGGVGDFEWEDASGRSIAGLHQCTTTCTRNYKVGGQAFMVSPEGAPAPYGYLTPMTVRSVGFGLMPVEATVQISQRRKDGYPVPFESWLDAFDHWRQVDMSQGVGAVATKLSTGGYPTRFEDAVDVRILKVLVDGVDLGLTGECRTATPAPMRLGAPKYTIDLTQTTSEAWFAHADPSEFFHPEKGGQLSGTITIPPFTGCTTASGDDLSDLMTLSVSGPDNPVTARVAWPCEPLDEDTGAILGRPLRQGENTPKRTLDTAISADIGKLGASGCHGTKKLPYPVRPVD